MRGFLPQVDIKFGGQIAPISTSQETEVVLIDDSNYVVGNTQLSIFVEHTLGSLNSIELRYYYATGEKDGSGNLKWFQVPVKDASTGELMNRPSVLNSSSPTKVVEDIGISRAIAFRITARGVGASNTGSSIKVSVGMGIN
jgi:hypothetical protein